MTDSPDDVHAALAREGEAGVFMRLEAARALRAGMGLKRERHPLDTSNPTNEGEALAAACRARDELVAALPDAEPALRRAIKKRLTQIAELPLATVPATVTVADLVAQVGDLGGDLGG